MDLLYGNESVENKCDVRIRPHFAKKFEMTTILKSKKSPLPFQKFRQETFLLGLTKFNVLEHKIGIDLTVSLTLKKPSKNYTFLLLF